MPYLQLQAPSKVDFTAPIVTPGADEPLGRGTCRGLDRPMAAEVLDFNLWFLGRAHILIDRAIGRGLKRLTKPRLMDIGFSSLEDYARESLGVSGRHAEELAWLERTLENYPEIDAAYEDGRLLRSKVRLLLRKLTPRDAAAWLERAVDLSVRGLRDALEAECKPSAAPSENTEDDPEQGRWIDLSLTPAQRLKFDVAVELARRMSGANLPLHACVEIFVAEFMSESPPMPERARWMPTDAELEARAQAAREERREHAAAMARNQAAVEDDTGKWAFLHWEIPQVNLAADVGIEPPPDADAAAVDACLQAAVRLRQRIAGYMMRMLRNVADYRFFNDMLFHNFDQYVRERLGISSRTARKYIALERWFFRRPRVAEAFYSGVLNQAQATLLVEVAGERTEKAWVEHAPTVTVKQLKADVEEACRRRERTHDAYPPAPRTEARLPASSEDTERPTCAPAENTERPVCASAEDAERPAADALERPACAPEQPEITVREYLKSFPHLTDPEGDRRPLRFLLPDELLPLWDDAVRRCAPQWGPLPALEDCLEVFCDAFLETYRREALAEIRRHPVEERDGYLCSVPVCTQRRFLHKHHVDPRAQGGSDDRENLATTCAGHHQQGVHEGKIRVAGTAPDGLRWELGVRRDGTARLVVEGRRIIPQTAARALLPLDAMPRHGAVR